ncbi:MAG: GNAT family N-acetyltransferase [Kineosporiaceae bacterium]|nr:GNAT family N-acetyltransferase [Kineosporiaceae bacterium]
MPRLVAPTVRPGALGPSQPRLAGHGVLLRPWAPTDAPALVAAYADPDIQRWHCRSLDDGEAPQLIDEWRQAWAAGTGASWAVVDPGGGLLGRVGLREVDLAGGLAELAYWVLPTARRRGVAVAAVRTLSRWAFDQVGLQRLELVHSTANQASCGVAGAAGFPFEGTLRGCVEHTDGWHDMHLHARIRTDADPGPA